MIFPKRLKENRIVPIQESGKGKKEEKGGKLESRMDDTIQY
jgi:hypothetical protein